MAYYTQKVRFGISPSWKQVVAIVTCEEGVWWYKFNGGKERRFDTFQEVLVDLNEVYEEWKCGRRLSS